jgi:transcriptional regulator of heat shock response
MEPMLSERQELILRLVVEAYLTSGTPVPSKEIAGSAEVEWSASTVRSELAALEAAGFLTHPHTSAGRVPTEAGYRYYVDRLIESGTPIAARVELELSRLRREIDEAMRETTAALAQVTDLMALVTAPPLGGDTLYMHGVSRLLSAEHLAELPHVDELMGALERRAGVLGMMRSALEERSVFFWIGGENPQPELRSVSVVGANYGLSGRNLGAVGVVGPLRMDYATAISSVRGAARELSRYCETVYDG